MYKLDFLDNTYYFCSETCKAKFNRDPVRYTGTGEHHEHSRHHCCC
ncbi:MAG: YHS domain-containing protein [Candidatus Helarchaeota archaeon]|nr:YHS domain-containing protein [Candidatus Helarchaeota archaeon]